MQQKARDWVSIGVLVSPGCLPLTDPLEQKLHLLGHPPHLLPSSAGPPTPGLFASHGPLQQPQKVVHPDGSAPSRHDFPGGLGDGDQSKQDTWGSLVPNTNRELAKDEESEPKNST